MATKRRTTNPLLFVVIGATQHEDGLTITRVVDNTGQHHQIAMMRQQHGNGTTTGTDRALPAWTP